MIPCLVGPILLNPWKPWMPQKSPIAPGWSQSQFLKEAPPRDGCTCSACIISSKVHLPAGCSTLPLWRHMSEPSRVSSLEIVGLAPVVPAFCCGRGSVLRWVRSCPALVPLWVSVSVSGTWGRRRGTKHLPGLGWRQRQWVFFQQEPEWSYTSFLMSLAYWLPHPPWLFSISVQILFYF